MDIQKMNIEEKIASLSDTDKAYVMGYVDRALREFTQKKKKTAARGANAGKGVFIRDSAINRG